MLLQMALFHSFLWLSSIPLCIYTCVCVCVCVYHIFFIHLLIVVCFHGLVIVNSASMNTGCMYVFKLQFCLDICPGVGLLDHMAILFLVFWGASILFSMVAAPIYFPTNSAGGKNHILKTFTLVDKCLLIPQLCGLQVPPFPYNFLPCWDKLGWPNLMSSLPACYLDLWSRAWSLVSS